MPGSGLSGGGEGERPLRVPGLQPGIGVHAGGEDSSRVGKGEQTGCQSSQGLQAAPRRGGRGGPERWSHLWEVTQHLAAGSSHQCLSEPRRKRGETQSSLSDEVPRSPNSLFPDVHPNPPPGPEYPQSCGERRSARCLCCPCCYAASSGGVKGGDLGQSGGSRSGRGQRRNPDRGGCLPLAPPTGSRDTLGWK